MGEGVLFAGGGDGTATAGSCRRSSFIHDLCKAVAKRAGLDSEKWHMHRFRDTAAMRWLRAGIDVRTVQAWLGHESLATTQKYLKPSKESEKSSTG